MVTAAFWRLQCFPTALLATARKTHTPDVDKLTPKSVQLYSPAKDGEALPSAKARWNDCWLSDPWIWSLSGPVEKVGRTLDDGHVRSVTPIVAARGEAVGTKSDEWVLNGLWTELACSAQGEIKLCWKKVKKQNESCLEASPSCWRRRKWKQKEKEENTTLQWGSKMWKIRNASVINKNKKTTNGKMRSHFKVNTMRQFRERQGWMKGETDMDPTERKILKKECG